MRNFVVATWAIACCRGFTFGPPSVSSRSRRHRPFAQLATSNSFYDAANEPASDSRSSRAARLVKTENERGRLMSALYKAVRARPKRQQTCEAAAHAVEHYLTSVDQQPRSKEWTLIISGWGAARRPDEALRCLGCAEVEMARQQEQPVVAPQSDIIRPKAVFGAAVSALCTCGDIKGASNLLQRMRDAGAPPDSREWGALLQALALKSDWVGVEAALEECTILRGEVEATSAVAMEARVGLALKNSDTSSSGVAKVRKLLGNLDVATNDRAKVAAPLTELKAQQQQQQQQQRQQQQPLQDHSHQERPFALSRHLRSDLLTSILLEMPTNSPLDRSPTAATTMSRAGVSIASAQTDSAEALTWALSSAVTRPDAGGCQRAFAACAAATPPRWQAALLLLNAMQKPLIRTSPEALTSNRKSADTRSAAAAEAEGEPTPTVQLTLDCVATAMTACLRGGQPAAALELFHRASTKQLIDLMDAPSSRRSKLVLAQCAFRACSALEDGASAEKVWDSSNRAALRPDARLAAAAVDALAYVPWPPQLKHHHHNGDDDDDVYDKNDDISSETLDNLESASSSIGAVEWPLSVAHAALLSADAAGAFVGEEEPSHRRPKRRITSERGHSNASTWSAPLCAAVLRSYRPPQLLSPTAEDEDALSSSETNASAEMPSTSHVGGAHARVERVLTFLDHCHSREVRFEKASTCNYDPSSSISRSSSANSNHLHTTLWESASADVLAACAPAAAIDGPEVLNEALAALKLLASEAIPRTRTSSNNRSNSCSSISTTGSINKSYDGKDQKPMPEAAVVGLALRRLRLANLAEDALPLVNLLRDRFIVPALSLGSEASAVAASAGSSEVATEEEENVKEVQELAAWVHMEAVQCYLDSGRPQYAVAWLSSLPRKSVPQISTPAADTIAAASSTSDAAAAAIAASAPELRSQELPEGVSLRTSPLASSQGSAAIGATAEVYANVMRACLKRMRVLEDAMPSKRTSAWTEDSSTGSFSRPSSSVGVRKALAADEVPEPVIDLDDADNDDNVDHGSIEERQNLEGESIRFKEQDEDEDDDGYGYGADAIMEEFDVEAAWALAEREGGALDEAARQLEVAAAAVAEASELREAVLVLYEEMKLREVRPCASGVLQYLEACRADQLWRAATTALLRDLHYSSTRAKAQEEEEQEEASRAGVEVEKATVSPSSVDASSVDHSKEGSFVAIATKAHYVSVLRTLRDSGQVVGCTRLLKALITRQAPGLDAGCFNVALGACADAGDAGLALRVAKDMKAAKVQPNAATFQARLRATAAASRLAGEARPGLALRRAVTQCRGDGCPPGLGAYKVTIKAAAGGASGGGVGGKGGRGRVKAPSSSSSLRRKNAGGTRRRPSDRGKAKGKHENEVEAEGGEEDEDANNVKRQRMLGPPITSDRSSSSSSSSSSTSGENTLSSATAADFSSQAIALGRAADCEALCWMAIADGIPLDTACVNALLSALANAGAAHKAVALLDYLIKAAAETTAAAAAAELEAVDEYGPWSGVQFSAGTRVNGATFSFALAACAESDRSDAEMLAAAAPAVALLESFLLPLPPSLDEGPEYPPSELAAAAAERLVEVARGYLTPRGLRALDAIHSAQANAQELA